MSALRVLISTSSFGKADPAPLARLEHEGIECRLNPFGRVLTEAEVAELLRDVDGVIAGTEPLTERVLTGAERLRVISRVGIGLESVDVAAASRCGVQVFNTPDAVTDAVAELTVGGMLMLLRRAGEMDAAMRAGRWEKLMGALLRGRTVGIVGLGRIGRAVVQLLEPFGARRVAADVAPDREWAAAHDVEVLPLAALLRKADVVTVHTTAGAGVVLGRAEIAAMKPGAYLVNTARGGLVDEDAVRDALAAGSLAGCYLDTFEREPYSGPLVSMPNTLLTPHIGSYAREARARMEHEAVENLLAGLQDGGS